MTRQIIFRPEAVDEIVETKQWYEERRAALGGEFEAAVDDALLRITANPLAFPLTHNETRRAILRRFPYAVYFQMSDDDIVVLAVIGRQNPRQWKSRQ